MSSNEARQSKERLGSPLRVCMVHYYDFHVDSRLQRQAGALAESGAEVDVVCLSRPAVLRRGDGVVRLHCVGGTKRRGSPLDFVRGYVRFLLGAFRKVSSLDRTHRFDVVSVHNAPDFVTLAALVPRLRGTPVVFDVHDPFPDFFSSTYRLPMDHPLVGLVKLEERLSAAVATSVVTVHQEARERLEARGIGGGAYIPVFLNTPDERVFGPPRPPASVPAEGAVRVVYHGGLAPRYGVDTLIRAFGLTAPTLPRARLEVYGLFEGLEETMALAREVAPERVFIAPSPTPFEEIPSKLAGAHLGVVPPILDTFNELVLPVKLFEYVHLGLPVIASRIPVVERYFDESQLYYFESGSPESLAGALEDACGDPEEARARAVRAGERLEQLAWSRQRAEYVKFIRGLARDGRAGRPRRRG